MNAGHLHRVRTAAIRVAFAATAIVGAAYILVAISVVVIVSQRLTAQVDARLSHSLVRLVEDPSRFAGESFIREPPGGPRFGPPLLVWVIRPDGGVTGNVGNAVLPKGVEADTGPRTISIGGTDVRIVGRTVGDTRVVLGQTMESVAQARSNLELAEVGIGPVLLLLVFFGALSIGRRVAAPIERARQRQMDFTADASHELRTPLSVIEAQTALALSAPRDEGWYQAAFERVDREGKRMRRLVDDLLWLARFDSTAARPGSELVDMGSLAAQAVDRFQAVGEARGLSVRVAVDASSSIVSAPPEWLDRLLGVLLDNACRYSPDGGAVEVIVRADDSRVRAVVEDSGPGIPEAQRPRIFDRFHRLSDSPGGAGLGLSIADAIVGATGGRWDIGSAPDGGASMAVHWPRAVIPGPSRET